MFSVQMYSEGGNSKRNEVSKVLQSTNFPRNQAISINRIIYNRNKTTKKKRMGERGWEKLQRLVTSFIFLKNLTRNNFKDKIFRISKISHEI